MSNQFSGNIIPNQLQAGYGMKRYMLGMVNNRDEAMMFNVPVGCCAYIFNANDPEFYVKDNANLSGQCTFADYIYEEKPAEKPPVVNTSEYVTRDDFDTFANNVMNAIKQLKGDEVCG